MDNTNTSLKNFLELPYDALEKMNIKAGEQTGEDPKVLEKEYRAYLQKEKRIKVVTICFTDIEGRFHMLDYDKNFLLENTANLTFDGSSIRGFSKQHESDLRLGVDWSSIVHIPSDVFGAGKVVFFASILARDRTPYISDFRGQLQRYTQKLKKEKGIMAYASAEIEGFVADGVNAEQTYREDAGFRLISTGGYYYSLPLDKLRRFIDKSTEAHRAMGFRNEKDHPEVAPSQFEMNFSYSEALRACDKIQLYKLVCRQVAESMGLTAIFLPKPVAGINGSGMHTNFSLAKNGKNIFYDARGQDGLSKTAWDFILKILNHAPETCLIFSSSVNAYRRLDPHFEAPNQIRVSPIDRGAMIRIPVGNERSARIEIRSVAPDANPYLLMFTILKVGMEGRVEGNSDRKKSVRFLPSNIYDAIKLFKTSDFITKIIGEENKEKFVSCKLACADRNPKELGVIVKAAEILYHHEVTNQVLWNRF